MKESQIREIKERASVFFKDSANRFCDDLFLTRCVLQATKDICEKYDIDIKEVPEFLGE